MHATTPTIVLVFALAPALVSRADPPQTNENPRPLTSQELSGIWRGEKNGVTIEIVFRSPEFRGNKDDADWGIRDKSGSIFATLKRVNNKESGSVHLRLDSVAKPTGTVVGYLERDDDDALKITILPAATGISKQDKTVTDFPLRKALQLKLFAK